jgi:hypothetical protein
MNGKTLWKEMSPSISGQIFGQAYYPGKCKRNYQKNSFERIIEIIYNTKQNRNEFDNCWSNVGL